MSQAQETSDRRPRKAKLPEERKLYVLELLKTRRLIRAETLADDLGVSLETVRRDLLALEREGNIRRVYGGVAGVGTRPDEPPFDTRVVEHTDAKRSMAELAVSLIPQRSTIMLDVGTSVADVARHIPHSFEGRVITTSLIVAAELAGRPGLELVVAGGSIRGGDLACYGPETLAVLQNYYGGIAFVGSGGVDPNAGLTDHYRDEVSSRRIIMAQCDDVYVMADSSKLGVVAPVKVCDLRELTGIVTDAGADRSIVSAFEAAGTQVLIPEG